MTRSRRCLLALFPVLVATSLAVSAPAHADPEGLPQTLYFTSEPPTDAVVGYRYFYAVTAESSSGLPVELSADPSTPACGVSPVPPFIYGNVVPLHAGTCTVFADQPGNEEYAAAERISMTFEIARELTVLEAKKATKGILGLSGTVFSANLRYQGWFGPSYGALFPYTGQEVTFSVGGKKICTGTTKAVDDGSMFGAAIATCKAPIGVNAALTQSTYTAAFEGSQDYLPATATGVLR